MFSYGFTSKGSAFVTLTFILFIIFICTFSPKNPPKFITVSDCLSPFFSHIGHLFTPDMYVFKRCVLIKNVKIRPVARKGYGSIGHEAKPNVLLTRGP